MSIEQPDVSGSGVDHTTTAPGGSSVAAASASNWFRNSLAGFACVAVGVGIAVPAINALDPEVEVTPTAAVVQRTQIHRTIDIWLDPHPAPKAIAVAQRGRAPKTVKPSAHVVAAIVSQDEVLRLVQANFPAHEVGNAMAVASCESGQQSIVGQTNSDGTTDWGVFQLNDGGTLQGAMARIGAPSETAAAQFAALDAATNIRAAAAIFATRGWSPWVCAYKQQIVASLYGSAPGPMYGKFTLVGGGMPALLTQEEAAQKVLAAERQAAAAKRRAAKAAQAAAKRAAQEAARRKAAEPAPVTPTTPRPISEPAPNPAPSLSPTPTTIPSPDATD